MAALAVRTCSIEGCTTKHDARGYCSRHYNRWRLYGDPVAPDRRGQHMNGRSQERNPAWKGEGITYAGVHKRLERYRGRASEQVCEKCGGAADDWAFDEPRGFSADLSRYRPLCRQCHNVEDHRG